MVVGKHLVLSGIRVRTLMLTVAVVAVQCVLLRANSHAVMDYYGRSWAIVIVVHSACVITLCIVAWRAWMSTSRFRVWAAIIAIALAGVIVPAPEVVRRRQIARGWVSVFERQENESRMIAVYWKKLGELYADAPTSVVERLRREAEVDALWRPSEPPRSTFQSLSEIDRRGTRMIIQRASDEARRSTAQGDWYRTKRDRWNRAAFRCYWEELPSDY